MLVKNICDPLCNLVPFVQFKNIKNTHGGVLPLVKLRTESYLYYEMIIFQSVISKA